MILEQARILKMKRDKEFFLFNFMYLSDLSDLPVWAI